MSLLNSVMNEFWLITPEKLSEIIAFLESRELVNDYKALSVEDTGSYQPYEIQDGIGILNIRGIISKRQNLIQSISGGTSTELASKNFQKLLKDPTVKQIVLKIDSPGGSGIDAIQIFSDEIFAARGVKPVIAFVDGLMASAGLWIGSSASQIIASSSASQVGSVGVISAHTQLLEANTKAGKVVTVFATGKYKKTGNIYEKLSSGDKTYIQGKLDHIFTLFCNNLARNLGMSAATINTKFGNGSTFFADEALKIGLIHSIETWNSLLARLRNNQNNKANIATESKRGNTDMKKVETFSLRNFMENLQNCDDLNELKSIENQTLVHLEEVKQNSKNWLEKERAGSMTRQVIQLISHRRRQIMSQPTKKDLDDYDLGTRIGLAQ